jgi:UDP-N-acetylglucosamine diphosphorylase / glucose-1-phosphate thymidylyltransferase / UDP-N-acetylgalactosamine diphosphorylase / glucosamine-1-phosphate N-acetyltransferase / galactosamine-1-phosphate N-acetyltransferase
VHKIAQVTIDPRLVEGRNVVLFEDSASEIELFPLNVLRPSWEIHSGMGCLRKWVQELAGVEAVHLRPLAQLSAVSALLAGQNNHSIDPNRETVFINGRVLGFWSGESELKASIPSVAKDSKGRPLAAVLHGAQAQELSKLPGTEIADLLVQQLETSPLENVNWTVKFAEYVWDFMTNNSSLLEKQLQTGVADGEIAGAQALREHVIGIDIIGDHPVYLGKDVKLCPMTVMSTEGGPIWVGEETEIEPHCFLKGPLYIGERCRIKAGTRLYGGSSFGPECRLAGEISQSVFQGYVNKQHEGFIGNSILGEWVNIGAGTNCSNLRNDYDQVKMKVGGETVDSGNRFIGLICGDHTKTGINTMFNTGSIVGVGVNVYGAGFPTRMIRSFSWGGARGFKNVPFERTLQAARIAVARRGKTISRQEESLLRDHYQAMTNQEKHD